MEKYRRIDVSENIVRDQPAKEKYPSQYQSRAEKYENDTRYYIPMSQKGSRPIKYSNAGDQADLRPAVAMKMIYNQPRNEAP